MTKKKKDSKVALIRNSILGTVALIAIVIIGLGTYFGTGLNQGDITEGEDYRMVEYPRPTRPGDPIEVLEYFSYACVHCMNFDPTVEEWASQLPDDVTFRRVPATFSPVYALLSRTYLTFEAADVLKENHMHMFRAIHDAGRQFTSPESVADYVDGRGISAEEFLRKFNSPAVRDGMRRAERDQLTFQISATPQLVVAGKYVVGMTGGPNRALDVVEYLIDKERNVEGAAVENPPEPGGTPTSSSAQSSHTGAVRLTG